MALTDTVLTETIIDISDQHTVPTLTSTLALPLASDQDYCALHQRIAGSARQCASYSEVRGVEGKVLDQLCLGYVDEKFWHYILNDDIRRFPIHAWRSILPLVGSLKPRIEFLKGHWTFDIKPLTRVTIYPFGWSTRISLRIVGRHTISDLADVVDYIFNGQCIKPDGAPKALRLDQYFYDVAEGVREDAFAGSLTNDVPGAEPLMVITVLAKQGPSPSVKDQTSDDQATMLRLVRVRGQESSKPFSDHVRYLLPDDPFQYALVKGRKYFMWVQSLLHPVNRNRKKLRCHHCNTFESLERAGHMQALIDQAAGKEASAAAKSLTGAAADELSNAVKLGTPGYKGTLAWDFAASRAAR